MTFQYLEVVQRSEVEAGATWIRIRCHSRESQHRFMGKVRYSFCRQIQSSSFCWILGICNLL